ncbi:gephyrin-like molybdotransferase Glp [Dietzia sp. 179-F 9C3 NHS]|uniref:molybdopterin molybdotransferase MoeA n=1 Tax=Dietzia sp. 179-F 9C3 NHS TaxID=3374295 RepID=UPI003878FBD2
MASSHSDTARLSPDGYRELVRTHLAPMLVRAARSTRLPLIACADSVLARDLRAAVDLPLFVNSQMDGYAVRSADVAEASPDVPVRLRVVGAVHAGQEPGSRVGDGKACRIMTGAPVPEGADCVVPVEDTSPDPDEGSVVLVRAPRARGEFVRSPGDDVRAGDVVIPAGVQLRARHLAAAASLGESALDVRPRPRVGVVATGSELVAPGRPLSPGQIWDSNSLTLTAALKACGCDVTATLTSSDDRDEFSTALDSAVSGADLVVTVGAVSMGDAEVVRQVLDGRDGSRFAPIAMQPGGPQGISTWRDTPVVCLPGNPVSALVSFVVLLRPVILEAVGRSPVQPVRARLSHDVTSPAGKVQFLRAALGPDSGDGIPVVEPVSGPGSHLVASMARADVLVEIPADAISLAAGTEVEAVAL